MDERARDLERKARRTGERADWASYLANLRGGAERTRETCYSLLNEDPSGAKQPALEKLVEKGGVWVERDIEPEGFIHIHGVREQVGHDLRPYTLSWKKERFRHPAADESGPDADYFSQSTIARILGDECDLYAPTTKQIDATIRALSTHHQQTNRNPAPSGLDLIMRMTSDIEEHALTSTRIAYGVSVRIIHGWGKATGEQNIWNFAAAHGTLDELESLHFNDVTRGILGTTETIEQIKSRYRYVIAAPYTIAVELQTVAHTEGPVTIGSWNEDGVRSLIIGAYRIESAGPVRLVKAKPITSEDTR